MLQRKIGYRIEETQVLVEKGEEGILAVLTDGVLYYYIIYARELDK